MGRALSNNLVNLTAEQDVKQVLEELGVDYNLIEDRESDAGLGNGGRRAVWRHVFSTVWPLSRSTGSRATVSVTSYGMFQQKIVDGYQIENLRCG